MWNFKRETDLDRMECTEIDRQLDRISLSHNPNTLTFQLPKRTFRSHIGGIQLTLNRGKLHEKIQKLWVGKNGSKQEGNWLINPITLETKIRNITRETEGQNSKTSQEQFEIARGKLINFCLTKTSQTRPRIIDIITSVRVVKNLIFKRETDHFHWWNALFDKIGKLVGRGGYWIVQEGKGRTQIDPVTVEIDLKNKWYINNIIYQTLPDFKLCLPGGHCSHSSVKLALAARKVPRRKKSDMRNFPRESLTSRGKLSDIFFPKTK